MIRCRENKLYFLCFLITIHLHFVFIFVDISVLFLQFHLQFANPFKMCRRKSKDFQLSIASIFLKRHIVDCQIAMPIRLLNKCSIWTVSCKTEQNSVHQFVAFQMNFHWIDDEMGESFIFNRRFFQSTSFVSWICWIQFEENFFLHMRFFAHHIRSFSISVMVCFISSFLFVQHFLFYPLFSL